MDVWSYYLVQLKDVNFFELRHFGLKKYFKTLPIRLENISIIVLEGDGAVIDGFKDRKRSFPLTPKLTMTK